MLRSTLLYAALRCSTLLCAVLASASAEWMSVNSVSKRFSKLGCKAADAVAVAPWSKAAFAKAATQWTADCSWTKSSSGALLAKPCVNGKANSCLCSLSADKSGVINVLMVLKLGRTAAKLQPMLAPNTCSAVSQPRAGKGGAAGTNCEVAPFSNGKGTSACSEFYYKRTATKLALQTIPKAGVCSMCPKASPPPPPLASCKKNQYLSKGACPACPKGSTNAKPTGTSCACTSKTQKWSGGKCVLYCDTNRNDKTTNACVAKAIAMQSKKVCDFDTKGVTAANAMAVVSKLTAQKGWMGCKKTCDTEVTAFVAQCKADKCVADVAQLFALYPVVKAMCPCTGGAYGKCSEACGGGTQTFANEAGVACKKVTQDGASKACNAVACAPPPAPKAAASGASAAAVSLAALVVAVGVMLN